MRNPERWVEEHADALFAFAALRVSDHGVAQDLVQETFLARLRAEASFAGRSSERNWLLGILRNKLMDYYRLRGREIALNEGESLGPDEASLLPTPTNPVTTWTRHLITKTS